MLQCSWQVILLVGVNLWVYTYKWECSDTTLCGSVIMVGMSQNLMLQLSLHLTIHLYINNTLCWGWSVSAHLPMKVFRHNTACWGWSVSAHLPMKVFRHNTACWGWSVSAHLPMGMFRHDFKCTLTNGSVQTRLWVHTYQWECSDTTLSAHLPMGVFRQDFECTLTNGSVLTQLWVHTYQWECSDTTLSAHLPMGVFWHNFEWLCHCPCVPEFDFAVIATADQVILLVWVEVDIPNQLTVGILYGIHLPENQSLPTYIYNGTCIIFPSLNHAKIFDSIPDEQSHKVVRKLAKSHTQWFTSNKVKRVHK